MVDHRLPEGLLADLGRHQVRCVEHERPVAEGLGDGLGERPTRLALEAVGIGVRIAGQALDARHSVAAVRRDATAGGDRKSTRLNSIHVKISYAVVCLKKK